MKAPPEAQQKGFRRSSTLFRWTGMCLLATLFFETLVVPAESKLKQREWFVQSTPPAASKMTETNGFLAALVGGGGVLNFYDIRNGRWNDMTDFVVGDGPGYQSEGWTTAEDGKVYAVNFFQDSVTGPYTELFVLDPLALEWTNLSPRVSNTKYPSRTDFGAAILENRMYVFGGQVNGAGSNHLLVLDLGSSELPVEWQDLSAIATGSGPDMVWNHGMTATPTRVYVFGGVSSTLGNVPVNDLHAFDPQTRHWHDLSGLPGGPGPQSRRTMTSSGEILFLLGWSPEIADFAMFAFDPSGPAWTRISAANAHSGPFPEVVDEMALVAVHKQIFVWGDLFRLDLSSMTWTDLSGSAKGIAPLDSSGHLSDFGSVAVGDKLFVLKGWDLHMFETATRTWVDASSLTSGTPPSSSAASGGLRTAMVAVDNVIYVQTRADRPVYPYDYMTVLFAIDVETLAWSALSDSMSGDIPPGVTNHGLAAVGRTLYLYGGWDTVSGSLFRLGIDSLVWEDLTDRISGQAPEGQDSFGVAAIGPRIYFFGGYLASGDVSNALVYLDTESLSWSTIEAPNPPNPRVDTGMLAIGSVLYVSGGIGVPVVPDPLCLGCAWFFNDLHALDFDAPILEWKDLSGMIDGDSLPARSGHAFLAAGPMLHVVGGSNEGYGRGMNTITSEVYSIYAPQQLAWPTTTLGWLNVYDWDKLHLDPAVASHATLDVQLCERMWPCHMDLNGHGGSLAIHAGSKVVCRLGSGCQKVTLSGIDVSCVEPASEPWLHTEGAVLRMASSSVSGCTSVADGGFIDARDGASVVVSRVSMQASSRGSAGAIYVSEASLLVSDSEFIDCSAAAYGGAISASGVLQVVNTTFVRCSAGAEGGSIFVAESYSDLVVSECEFVSCASVGGGGAIGVMGSSVSVDASKVESCSTRGSGGAIRITESNDRLVQTSNIASISNSLIFNCTAAQSGGAISSRGGETRLASVCLRSNAGLGGGGGAIRAENAHLRVDNTLFRDNSAGQSGGAISGDGSEVAVSSSWFVKNTALGLGGGAVHLKDSVSSFSAISSKDNTAAAGGGGLVFWEGPDELEPRMSQISGAVCDVRTGPTCAAGYEARGSDDCVGCLPGAFKAEDGAHGCELCPEHTSSLPASTSLLDCVCEAGLSGPPGGPCRPCPAGHHKAGVGSEECAACPAGSFQLETGASHCATCPENHLHTGNSTVATCAACGDLTNAPAGSFLEAHCVCMPGFSGVAGECTACEAGKFKEGPGNGPCQSCPAGSFMPDPSATACELCPAGTFSQGLSDGTSCDVCPGLFERSPVGSTSAQACSAQHTFAACSGLCDCQGFYSVSGSFADGSEASGTYEPNSDCSWVVSSPGATAVSLALATVDLEPFWDTLTVWECMETQCIAPVRLLTVTGSHANVSLESSTGVLLVHFASDGATQHAGFTATWTTTSECPLGKVKGVGATCVEPSCLNCAEAVPANANFTSCNAALPSNAGSAYTAADTERYCHWECDAGWYQSGGSCVQCPPESVSAAGSASMWDCSCIAGMEALSADGCTPCSPGSFKAGTGPEACVACNPGSYQEGSGALACEPCPADTFQQGPRNTSNCVPCPEGTTSAAGQAVCNCAAGWFLPEVGPCQRCGPGTYSEIGSGCLSCPPGSFEEASGSTGCELCPAGTYQDGPQSARNCIECSAPLSGSPEGSSSESDCTTQNFFPAGHCTGVCECRAFYAVSGSFSDSPDGDFELGSWCEWIISAPDAVKVNIVFSEYSAGWDQSLLVYECKDLACSNPVQKHSVSYWSLAPSYPINSGIARVTFRAGTWGPRNGGFEATWTTATECDDDEFMGPGPYCEPPACSNCATALPVGSQPTMCDASIASNALAPYTAEQEAAFCGWQCASGYYLNDTECAACPENSGSWTVGSTTVADCKCNAGYTGPPEGPCVACTEGTYKGFSGSSPCSDCTGGRYTSSPTAARSCYSCYSNTYLFEGSCQSCPSFASSPYGSDRQELCACNAGYSGPFSGPCEPCGVGTYGVDGACVPCPAGSFQLGTGASVCETCPAGSYHEGSATEPKCAACDGPMYTAAPAGSSTADNCTLDYWFSECSGDCKCAGFWNETGSFVDGSGPWAEYSTRSDCTWIISSPGAVSVSLSFPEFHTHSRYSRMDISECSDMTCSEMVARYNVRGRRSPDEVFKIDTGIMHIRFTHGTYPVTGAGFEGQWTTSTECEEGLVRADGPFCRHMQCTNTPPDSAQFAFAKEYTGECAWECVADSYLFNGTCEACPARSTSPAGSVGRTACACAAGSAGADPDSCAECAAGKFKAAPGSDACQTCAAGSFATTLGATACVDCEAGSYHDGEASEAACTPCPAHSDAAQGSWDATHCICNAGYTAAAGGQACAACDAGAFKAEAGAQSCVSCAPGSYQTASGASTCVECPAGTYHNGAPDTAACETCPALSSSAPGSTDCVCDAAFSGPADMACVECLADLYDDQDRSGGCGAGVSGDDCNSALYGNCAASSRKRLELLVPELAYAGVPLEVVVRKRDFYDQVVLSDSTSSLQARLVLGAEEAQDAVSATFEGGISSVMQHGEAVFMLSVKPTFESWDQSSGQTVLYRTPYVVFAGLDSQTGVAMQSPVTMLNLSSGALPVCPRGYMLDLDQPTELGVPASCTLCRQGTYSLDPLAGTVPPTPSCLACPAGGSCFGGADVQFAVGEWVQSGGVWELKACPRGYSVLPGKNESFNQALQECRMCGTGSECDADSCIECSPCKPGRFKSSVGVDTCEECPANTFTEVTGASSLQACQACMKGSTTLGLSGRSSWSDCECDVDRYLVAVDQVCMVCPVGAKCADSAGTCALARPDVGCAVGAGEIIGTWERRPSGEFELLACPSGYELVKEVDGEFTHNVQQCRACSTELQYILNPNEHQCQTCPRGLTCHGNHVTEPEVANSTWVADGEYMRLLDCPSGYLVVNSSLDQQYCKRCEALTYSRNPTDGCSDTFPPCGERKCQTCPNGAECLGGDHFRPLASGSVWELLPDTGSGSQTFRVRSCPAGYILVRSESPLSDTCVLCPAGRYSAVPAQFPDTLAVPLAQNALDRCNPCELGMNCSLGGSNISNLPDYWFVLPRRREVTSSPVIKTYRCEPGACLPGGECSEGRTGILCGLCAAGWARAGASCKSCGTAAPKVYQYAALGLIIPITMVAWYFISWRAFLAPEEESGSRGLEMANPMRCKGVQWLVAKVAQLFLDHDVLSYAKVFISFFQIASTFDTTFQIEWPEALRTVWRLGAFLRLQVMDLPGASCIAADWSYLAVLQAYTITPTLVALMLWVPVCLMLASRKTGGKKFKKVSDRFYFAFMFWAFLIYPNLAIMTLKGLRCTEVAGQDLLAVDLRAPCPSNSPGSVEFLWPLITTLMFPVGIPLVVYYALRSSGIPGLAKKKVRDATLKQMILKHRELSVHMVETKIASRLNLLATAAPESAKDPTRVVFERVRDDRGQVSCQMLLNYFQNSGVFHENRDVFESMFQHYCAADSATISFEQLEALFSDIKAKGRVMDEFVTCATISNTDLNRLVHFRWTDMLDAEENHETMVTKALRKQVEKAKRASVQGLLDGTAEHRKKQRRASLILQHRDSQEDAEAIPSSASRSEKLASLLEIGDEMIERSAISLPMLSWDADSADPHERQAVDQFGFLFKSNRVQVWYFEILELLRKFLLTGVLVFVYPDTPEQIACGFVVTAFFFILYGKMNPFRQHGVNQMQNISMLTQAVTLFYGLMDGMSRLREGQSGGTDNNAMVFLLCFLHGLVFVLPLDGMFPFLREKFVKTIEAARNSLFPPNENESEAELDGKDSLHPADESGRGIDGHRESIADLVVGEGVFEREGLAFVASLRPTSSAFPPASGIDSPPQGGSAEQAIHPEDVAPSFAPPLETLHISNLKYEPPDEVRVGVQGGEASQAESGGLMC